ncbi:MAG: bifunctional 3-phosphoshikimate 1-carboxyvinyltransferase/cytidylate kinase [Zoogloeaceae bacterium]|jgi:3-phosphoshikimate 1-carboxyvinyltransferase|nr:bifunctional 3-phosphoshikimate 1-carboxyvinyltransferase/cytidylate kinase [Zoogloeaceae bacterium]
MTFLDLPQMIFARGSVCLPGSKSISNRALLLAALAEGVSEIENLLASDDTARMQEALRTLGVEADDLGAGKWRIHGCAGQIPVRRAELFLGNAGTAFRSLTAVLALADGDYTLTGVPRMQERPIGDLVDALRQLGAQIEYLGRAGYPPLRIRKRVPSKEGQQGGKVVRVRGDVSSQFLTGLLLALPLTGEKTSVEVTGTLISRPYVDITLELMARFGVSVERQGEQSFTLPAAARYVAPGAFYVEGDASSASYFLALGAIGAVDSVGAADAGVRVEGVGGKSIQGDVRFAEALAEMGATIEMGEHWMRASAPAAGLRGITLDCNHIPDAAMTLAVAALFAKGRTRIENIASWRVKETDRIAAMARELGKLGARVEEGEDYLCITPPDAGHPARAAMIDTYDDHRMSMCFSLASFATPLRIQHPECVAKTFPEYFRHFALVAHPAPVIAIDGPTASGKGTVSARVAAALGFHYLDSGALYRLTALAAQDAGVDWQDEAALAALAATLDVTFSAGRVLLNGREVSDALRSEAISSAASQVAALPAVRAALLFRQRAFHRAPGLVGDGRDMASVVFPAAPLKIFLTASAPVRAERRWRQLLEKGQDADREAILADLKARDERDRTRPVAPLRQETDARLLDTDTLDIESAVAQVLAWWRETRNVKK